MTELLKDGRLLPWFTIEESGGDVNGRTPGQEIDDAIRIGLAGISGEQVPTIPITIEPSIMISTVGAGKDTAVAQVDEKDALTRTDAVRAVLAEYYDETIAGRANVGYGASVIGSVDPKKPELGQSREGNAKAIFAVPTVNNALIGGASKLSNRPMKSILGKSIILF